MLLNLLILTFLSFGLSHAQDQLGDEGLGGVQFNLHKENYFYPYYRTSPAPRDANKKQEFKFQFSIKLSVLDFGSGELNVAYTQKAFWQLYDADNSRPFRETNYNPEVFYRFKGKTFFFDLGYEHESNGKEDPVSRSWDRIYGKLFLLAGNFKLTYKLWTIIDEERYGPEVPERAEKMSTFMGYQEMELAAFAFGTLFKVRGRHNSSTGKGYIESNMMWPIFKKVLFGFTYSNGYGDSLRSYNLKHHTAGVGFLVNP